MSTPDTDKEGQHTACARAHEIPALLALLMASLGLGWWMQSFGATWVLFFGGLWLQAWVSRLVMALIAHWEDRRDD
jgi:hypothetical protein